MVMPRWSVNLPILFLARLNGLSLPRKSMVKLREGGGGGGGVRVFIINFHSSMWPDRLLDKSLARFLYYFIAIADYSKNCSLFSL